MPEEFHDRRKADLSLVEIKVDIKYLIEKVDKIEERLAKDYVPQDQFYPVKVAFYTLLSAIGLGMAAAILKLLLK
jgi:hypothetical protein